MLKVFESSVSVIQSSGNLRSGGDGGPVGETWETHFTDYRMLN